MGVKPFAALGCMQEYKNKDREDLIRLIWIRKLCKKELHVSMELKERVI
jgi:hypothetical protein